MAERPPPSELGGAPGAAVLLRQQGLDETLHVSSEFGRQLVDHFSDPHIALSIARIECHYFSNDCFLRPNQLLEDMDRIAHIPGFIVHGRYDMVCPIDQAMLLKERWPDARLKIIGDAGHAVTEQGISRALVESCDAMLEIVA